MRGEEKHREDERSGCLLSSVWGGFLGARCRLGGNRIVGDRLHRAIERAVAGEGECLELDAGTLALAHKTLVLVEQHRFHFECRAVGHHHHQALAGLHDLAKGGDFHLLHAAGNRGFQRARPLEQFRLGEILPQRADLLVRIGQFRHQLVEIGFVAFALARFERGFGCSEFGDVAFVGDNRQQLILLALARVDGARLDAEATAFEFLEDIEPVAGQIDQLLALGQRFGAALDLDFLRGNVGRETELFRLICGQTTIKVSHGL